MIHKFDIGTLPKVEKVYKVTRRTVWQLSDPYNILLLILEGRCSITVENEEFTLSKGDLFFIPENQNYLRQPINNEMCTLLYIHFKAATPITSMSHDEAREEIAVTKSAINENVLGESSLPSKFHYNVYLANRIESAEFEEELFSLGRKTAESNMKNHLESRLLTALFLSQILAIGTKLTLSQLSPGGSVNLDKAVPPNLKKAIMFIKQNLAQKISLEDLCLYCSVTKQQMIRYFKTDLKTTPMQYILQLKIDRAKELFLSYPHLSVKEVANEMGFEDAHYFSRAFAKISGESPGTFKSRVHHFNEKNQ
ncbi:MAG: AraC family transcriptional regulator [Bacillota bacterium]|nr:AraC family transcriptional regulator [Bacillota bacterium]